MLLLGVMLSGAAEARDAGTPSPDEQATEALARMTLDEKLALIHGPMLSLLPERERPAGVAIGAGYIAGVPRLGIPPLVETDAGLGVSNLNNLRKGDVATAMPSGLAQAATWNIDLVRAAGVTVGSEAQAKGFNVMLAGGVNLVRDPRNGRNFEYFGEDPLLAGLLAGAQIAGIQSNGMISTIKHFAANALETGRNVHSINMSEKVLRESDLLAFEIGIEQGKPGAVMCAYNRVNGDFACQNSFLLNDVLRRDWGFPGFVMSDWGAVHSSEAILAGLDQQSGEQIDGKRWFSDLMLKAVAEGRIPQSVIDTAARRVIRTIYAHGLVGGRPADSSAIDYEANAAVAQRVAEQGMVLLRNEGAILPLAATARKIVVVGGHADIGVLSGGGSSQVRPVGGFALELGQKGGGTTAFAKRSYGTSSPLAALRAARSDAEITFVDGADPAVAAAAARGADIAIVFGEKWATEAVDAKDLSLDDNGDTLVAAVAAANSNTIAVLELGNPVDMPWRDKVRGILVSWFPGQRGGEAIARILTGAANPSGRLPMTFPAHVAQLPNPILPGSDAPPADSHDRAVYGLLANTKPFDVTFPEGADVGYRWYDRTKAAPLYPFGFGLSYTRFRYSGLQVMGGRDLTVRFLVTNSGERAGADIPQIYVRAPGKAKQLIGWGRPDLKPGEEQEIVIKADPRLLADFDVKRRRWIVAPGTYEIEVAMSATSTSLRAKTRIQGFSIKP